MRSYNANLRAVHTKNNNYNENYNGNVVSVYTDEQSVNRDAEHVWCAPAVSAPYQWINGYLRPVTAGCCSEKQKENHKVLQKMREVKKIQCCHETGHLKYLLL